MKWRSLPELAPKSSTRRLYEIYAERRELIARYVPAEIQAIHAQVVEELKQSGIAQKALQPGMAAPAFELPDHNGQIVRSLICGNAGRWSSASFAGAGVRFASDRWRR